MDLRPEINERRFSRSRKSPPRRYVSRGAKYEML